MPLHVASYAVDAVGRQLTVPGVQPAPRQLVGAVAVVFVDVDDTDAAGIGTHP